MFWTILIYFLLTFYVLDCAFLGLVIMMQRSKQEGLGAAFGGSMMSDTFGAQTSQVLIKATVWAAIIFFTLSIVLARLYSHVDVAAASKGSPVQQLLSQPVTPVKPATTPAPTTSAPAPATTAPATTTTSSVAPAATTPAPVAPSTTTKPATTTPAPATTTKPAAK